MPKRRPFLNCDASELATIIVALQGFFDKRLDEEGASVVECREINGLRRECELELRIKMRTHDQELPQAWQPTNVEAFEKD